MLGKLRGEFFPAVFGKARNQPLNEATVHKKFKQEARKTGLSPTALAEGFLRVAVENMAGAIRRISVARGIDPESGALIAFGGAAGQHACALADAVCIRRIIISRYACVLSAWGIGMADIGVIKQRSMECDINHQTVRTVLDELAQQATNELPRQSAASGDKKITMRLRCRYENVDSILPVVWREGNADAMRADFEKMHKTRYGYHEPAKKLSPPLPKRKQKLLATR